jgi:hypothetical protein
MSKVRMSKSEKLFFAGLYIAERNNEMQHLPLFVDSVFYTKKLKEGIVSAANRNGYNLKLYKTRLYNSFTKRFFNNYRINFA